MSSDDFCDFVPNADECQTDGDNVDPTNPDGKKDMDGDESDYDDDDMMGGAMKANMAFLLTAISGVAMPALWTMRYRTAEAIAAVGTVASTTNYFQLLDNLANYPMMAVHLVLSITQFLSMLGIAADINMMAWHVAGMVHMVLGTVYFIGFIVAHQMYHEIEEDSSNSAAVTEDAEEAMQWLESRSYAQTAWSTHSMLVLYMHHKQWMKAQWEALPEEKKGEYKEDHDMEDHDDDMFSRLFRF